MTWDVGPFASSPHHFAVWLAVTLLLGAPAAWASGRALARAWRTFGRGYYYALMLAGVANFLCYALFQVSAFPLFRIAADLYRGDENDALDMLLCFILTTLILEIFAHAGWRMTRARLMREQYPFLMAAVSPGRASGA